MGSNNPPEEFTVLVTGFGPFKKDYPLNPSWEIARKLPEYLPPAPKGSHGRPVPKLPPVRIVVYPEPIRVNYQVVRDLVPTLWGSGSGVADKQRQDNGAAGSDRYKLYRPPQRIDLAVHIGMAGPQLQWSLEHRAHRDGYAMKDVDDEFLGDQDRRLREGEDWVWYGIPPELLTDVDVDDVLTRWREYVSDSEFHLRSSVRISEDPGRFLCDFIYFSSLAHLFKAGERRRVVFLHVPCTNSDRNVELGGLMAQSLIRAVVESELARAGKLPEPEGAAS